MSTNLRAIHVELASCEVCEALVRFKEPAPGENCLCPRCEFPVELRKPNSIARTWALVLAAFVMYIPANLFAMMVIKQGGQSESDNILGGVAERVSESRRSPHDVAFAQRTPRSANGLNQGSHAPAETSQRRQRTPALTAGEPLYPLFCPYRTWPKV